LIFTYLSVLYDVDIEASACVLSSRYAMLCYACNNYATCDVHSTTPSSHWCMYLSPVALTTVSVSVYWLYTKADDTICNMSSVLLHESYWTAASIWPRSEPVPVPHSTLIRRSWPDPVSDIRCWVA